MAAAAAAADTDDEHLLAAAALQRVYCDGPLLAAVQRARVWPDSKDFVDTPMRAAPDEVFAAFHALPTPTTDDDVRAFVARWFHPGPPPPPRHHESSPSPSSSHLPSSPDASGGGGGGGGDAASDDDDASLLLRDWSPDGPPFAADVRPAHLRDFARRVHALWPSLARAPTSAGASSSSSFSSRGAPLASTSAPPAPSPPSSSSPSSSAAASASFSSLIPTPHVAVVPGERFRETYYWDSHWVVVGLLASGMRATAEGVVRNMLHLVATHGFVPNGARCYYLNRSQPPVLAASVAAVCAAHDYAADDDPSPPHQYQHRRRGVYTSPAAVALARDALPLLLDEYAYLTRPERVVRVYAKNTKNTAGDGGDNRDRRPVRQLSRYWAYTDKPRPESWREDTALAEEAGYIVEGAEGRGNDDGDTAAAAAAAAAVRLWREVATAAESGHDFGSRWLAADEDDKGDDSGNNKEAAATAGPSSLVSIRTTRVVPADLNGLMLKMERDVAAVARAVASAAETENEEGKGKEKEKEKDTSSSNDDGRSSTRGDDGDPAEIAARFEAAAARRCEAIADVLWDPASGRWRDLLLPEIASDPALASASSSSPSDAADADDARVVVFEDEGYTRGMHASDWVPLWCGAAAAAEEPSSAVPAGEEPSSSKTAATAAAAVASLRDSGLVLPGGVATSLAHTGHQWDFPNAWAPLVHMLAEGCDAFGGAEGRALARGVAQRWVEAGLMVCSHHHHVYIAYWYTKHPGPIVYSRTYSLDLSNSRRN